MMIKTDLDSVIRACDKALEKLKRKRDIIEVEDIRDIALHAKRSGEIYCQISKDTYKLIYLLA